MIPIYLPLADVSVDALLLLGLGWVVGFLSGLFGVGGGFLITPLLMFLGVPAPVAVATGASQVVASSVSGVLTQWRRRAVDPLMGGVLLLGGIAGAALGIFLFRLLSALGQIELTVQLCYVIFLGAVGLFMAKESLQSLARRRAGAPPRRAHVHRAAHGWPLKMKFRMSGLYISVIPPLGVGFFTGVLAAIMGVGGGFILVPAMIYLLGMPTRIVVGTSLFQILFVAAFTTLAHAVTSHTVDLLLALLLILGGAIGTQIGTQAGLRLHGDQLRIYLALLVLAVAVKIAGDLLWPPGDLYSLRYEVAA